MIKGVTIGRGGVPGSSPSEESLLHCKFVTKVFSCKKK